MMCSMPAPALASIQIAPLSHKTSRWRSPPRRSGYIFGVKNEDGVDNKDINHDKLGSELIKGLLYSYGKRFTTYAIRRSLETYQL